MCIALLVFDSDRTDTSLAASVVQDFINILEFDEKTDLLGRTDFPHFEGAVYSIPKFDVVQNLFYAAKED